MSELELEVSLLAEIGRRMQEISDLLRDYCDVHVTLTSPPLRPVPRTAASA